MVEVVFDAQTEWLIGVGVTLLGIASGGVWVLLRIFSSSISARLDQHGHSMGQRIDGHMAAEEKTLREFRDAIQASQREMFELSMRVNKIEAKQESLPSKTDVHGLALSVTAMSGEMRAMQARLDGFNDIITRVDAMTQRQETFLLEGGHELRRSRA